MSVEWSIVRAGGATQTFEEAGIGNVTRRLVNQGVDTAEVLLARSDIFARPPWAYGETVVIKRDALVWFRGRMIKSRPAASGSSENLSITLAGAWWYLDQVIYLQSANFVYDFINSDFVDVGGNRSIDSDPGWPTASQLSSSVFLGQDALGAKIDSDEMIELAVEHCISRGGLLQLGTLDAGIGLQREALSAVTCGEIIRRALRWTPDHAAWFDYTTNPPTLHVRKRTNRTVKTFVIADRNVTNVALEERRDLIVPGVRVEYLREHERDGFIFRTQDVDTAGNGTALGAVIVSITLHGSHLVGGIIYDPEPIPTGVAEILYTAYQHVPWEGQIALVNEDCPADHWTRYTARVTGGNPAWKKMTADIQESADTTATGRTELTLGPPQHLGPVDLISLLRAGQTKPPTFPEQVRRTTGGGAGTPGIPAASGDPRLIFGSQQPQIVVLIQTHIANNSCTGQGTAPGTVSDVVVHTSGALYAYNLDVGQVVLWNGVSVGRAADVDRGLCGGSCPPPNPPAPTPTTYYIRADGTYGTTP